MLKNKITMKCLVVFLLFVSFNPLFAQTQMLDAALDPSALLNQQDSFNEKLNNNTANVLNKNSKIKNGQEQNIQNSDGGSVDGIIEVKKEKPSEIERIFSNSVSLEGFKKIKQFGYDIFKQSNSSFISPQKNTPVGENYVIGPGDSFSVTMWGVSEGNFKVAVNQNGEITLPKVGLISVAGLTYSQLKPFVETQLNRFYEGINIGITFDNIKTIQIYIVGEVQNPGNYPLSSLSTAYNALFYAGGPTKKGSLRDVRILRNGKVVAHLDLYSFLLKGDNSQDRALMAGDTVFVPLISSVVAVAGNVNRPAIYEIRGSADLADVLSLAGGINPSTYLNRIQIERTIAHEKNVVIDKEILLAKTKSNLDIPIQDMDLIKIFPIYSKISNGITVKGEVKYPGTYEYKKGIRLLDVLKEDDFLPFYNNQFPHIEVSRVSEDSNSTINVYPIDYEKLFVEKDNSININLYSKDEINVSASSDKIERVAIKGEVKWPGEYVIRDGERISSVIERAGGYTNLAYLYGSILTRKNVLEVQQENYSRMINNMELDLLRKERDVSSDFVAKEDIGFRQASIGQTKGVVDYMKVFSSTLKGRVVISLDEIAKLKNSKNDIEVEDGDVLNIPKTPKSVIVLGQVYNPTAIAYDPSRKTKDYMNIAGGTTPTANDLETYVIRANGSVISRRQEINLYSSKLYPGDTIIVPEKIDTRNFWSNVQDFSRWLFEAIVSVTVLAKVLR
ncbi:MAG: polysaccharide export protein [Candidatus Saganbacteria bacterium]|uniref:Polysaccharide export protein n=1 Tax=Candidatus Saganbacteria bacterium TaxID=2575572 RepID=A0A833P3P6_UNCSA|nr:MAG: polysaccharide export protein [Candidatus Saganbacteria bacterium]